jgi:hypothetical protein
MPSAVALRRISAAVAAGPESKAAALALIEWVQHGPDPWLRDGNPAWSAPAALFGPEKIADRLGIAAEWAATGRPNAVARPVPPKGRAAGPSTADYLAEALRQINSRTEVIDGFE